MLRSPAPAEPGTRIARATRMTAANYLMNARTSLDALAQLLSEAVEKEQPVSEIADEAFARLQDALAVIDTFGDDEGTE